MKAILKTTLLASTALLGLPVLAQTTGDPADKPTTTRHLKIITIENGVKTEIDTVMTGDEPAIWMDGERNNMEWEGEFPAPPDSAMEWEGEFPMPPDSALHGTMKRIRLGMPPAGPGGKHQIRMMRRPGGDIDIREFKMAEGDSTRHMFVIRKGGNTDQMMFMGCPGAPGNAECPMSFQMMRRERMDDSNVIRLDDPGIISYKKKVMKDGTEKIEIIRKQPKVRKVEVKAEVITNDKAPKN